MADGGYPGRARLRQIRGGSGAEINTDGYSGRAILARIRGGESDSHQASHKKKDKRGLLDDIKRYSGAEFADNLGKGIGRTVVGIGPGLYDIGKTVEEQTVSRITGNKKAQEKADAKAERIVRGTAKHYKDYYGHDVLKHIYNDPFQVITDAATVASGGASGAAKVGALAEKAGAVGKASKLADLGNRGEIVTRSPKAIATGKGPTHVDITSDKPIVKLREQAGAKVRSSERMRERRGGELQRYGKQVQAEANQHALSQLTHFEPYHKATRKLSEDEWAALHVRALDIHPDDLAEVWKGTPAEAVVTNPKVREFALSPSKRMLAAEPETRRLSKRGEALYRERGRLKEETAHARADLTKRQAAEVLGRPVRSITGESYYFPHTFDSVPARSPLENIGGGKGVPRKPGSMKQSTGALSLHGKLHLRGDVLGPEFLRRVKYVKYDEIHNALLRGAVPVTRKDIDARYGGKLPKGWEYIRVKASTKIPPSIRGEGETHIPIEKLIEDPNDLHGSALSKGFSTDDIAEAHSAKGRYFIVPTRMVKSATGEFTRSSDFTRTFVQKPLQVWRAAVLGLRVGFFTNNLVGNSVMYSVRTGGKGALRDLLGAIIETHGREVGLKALRSPATPPALRADLYKEFFPEQVRGTFGRTQSPATDSARVKAGRTVTEGARAVTGALPKLTSKVAEEYPRRALIRHFIRNSPEFKKTYKAMPAQARTFEAAARNVLKGEGGEAYQRFISKQVNQALGDYLNLSPVERNVLRNILPFYAWYKAISTVSFHLAADTPLRATILGQIGQIGKQYVDENLGELPSFLKGAIDLGQGEGGTEKVLSTQGLNPYATLEQLISGGTADVSDLGLNPFLMAAIQASSEIRGGQVSPGEIAAKSLFSIGRSLPPVRVIAPQKPSRLYPNRGRKSELLGYLGAPVKEANLAEARRQAKAGR